MQSPNKTQSKSPTSPKKKPSASGEGGITNNAFVLPISIALLVIVVAAVTIALLAINTDEGIARVVDTLQDQILALAESRFDQQLNTHFEVNTAQRKATERLVQAANVVANNATFAEGSSGLLIHNGFGPLFDEYSKILADFAFVDTVWVIMRTIHEDGGPSDLPASTVSLHGRALVAVSNNETHNWYVDEIYNGSVGNAIVWWPHVKYNTSALYNMTYADSPRKVAGYKGWTRPHWNAVDHSIRGDYSFVGPYHIPGLDESTGLFFSVASTASYDNGTFMGVTATNIYLKSLQAFFQQLVPSPNTIVFVAATNPANGIAELVCTSKGSILVNGARVFMNNSNVSAIRNVHTVVPKLGAVTNATRFTYEVAGAKWRLSAAPFTKLRTNFTLFVATPDDEFSKEVNEATRNTIIICVCIALVVFVLILLMMMQQHRLVEGSKQSVKVAAAVTYSLLLYENDEAAATLEAAKSAVFIDPETGAEQSNYVNQGLVASLTQINENMLLYKPHLPGFLFANSGTGVDEEDLEQNAKDADDEDQEKSKDPTKNDSTHHSRNDSIDIPGDAHAADPNNPYFVKMSNASKKSRNSDKSTHHRSTVGGGHAATTAAMTRVAMLRNSGDHVDRVIIANLNLSRVSDLVFPLGRNVKTANVNHINKVLEIILDTAALNEATVHSLVGDSLQLTWNSTHRTVHADIKGLRFVCHTDFLLKKEIAAWQQQQKDTGLTPLFDPHRSLLSGGLVNGSAWCQLGGSAKRQHFMLANFSESELMTTVHQLGIQGRFVAVCRTINQNTQHEFVFRGCGIHALPGNESVLFGNNSTSSERQFNNVFGSNNSLPHSTPDGDQQQVNPSDPNKKQPGRPGQLLATPIYELCHRKKNLGANDEWLYVVGGDKDSGSKSDITAKLFNECVMECCRANVDAASDILDHKIPTADPEAPQLSTYKILKYLVQRIRIAKQQH